MDIEIADRHLKEKETKKITYTQADTYETTSPYLENKESQGLTQARTTEPKQHRLHIACMTTRSHRHSYAHVRILSRKLDGDGRLCAGERRYNRRCLPGDLCLRLYACNVRRA